MAININDLPDEAPASPQPKPTPTSIRISDLPDSPTPKPTPTAININDLPDEPQRTEPQPTTSGGVRIQNNIQPGQVQDENPVEDTLKKGFKGAIKMLEPLTIPLRAEAGLVSKAIPGAEQALNPSGKILGTKSGYPFVSAPDVTMTDVSLYAFDRYMGSDNEMLEGYIKKGYSAESAALALTAYKTIPAYVLGTAADFLLDPLQFIGVGTVNKATREALEAGKNVSKIERNLVELRAPFGKSIEFPMEKAESAAKAVSGVVDKAESIPVIGKAIEKTRDFGTTAKEKASELIQSFNWHTGDTAIDAAATEHSSLLRGAPATTNKDFFEPYIARGFNNTEDKIIAQIEESSPNIKPNLPEPGRALSDKEIQHLGVDESALRKSVVEKVEKIGGLDPQRAQAIVDQVVDNKKMASQVLEFRNKAGKLDLEKDLSTQIIENYMTHKADPRALRELKKKYGKEAAVAKQEEILADDAKRALQAGGLTSHDFAGHQRKLRMDVFEANKEMLHKEGIKQFFIENSTIAGVMRLNEAKSLYINKRFIDQLEERGFKFVERQKKNGTWVKEFEAPAGKENIANKVNYWFTPRQSGNIAAYINSYYRVFRSTVLARPDYYLQNWFEGIFKNYVQGVKIGDYVDASKAIAKNGVIEVAGKQVPAEEINRLMLEWGVHHGHSNETAVLNQTIEMGKKMAANGEQISGHGPIKKIYNGVREFGVRGENWTREAMFINRIKQGYSPKMAAFDVEKFHFDFSRTTKNLDVLRIFSPFAQAPVKTAFIAGEMVGQNPRAFNYFQIQAMDAIERSFNDPTSAASIYQISPEWERFRDPIYGPTISNLMGGNSWIAAIAKNFFNDPRRKSQFGLPTDQVSYYMPIGLDVMSPLMVWEEQVLKQGVISSPVSTALSVLLFGRDPWTDQKIDIYKEGAGKLVQRFKEAGKSTLMAAVGMPNLVKFALQKYRVTDPEYFTPEAIMALHGSMGKFIRVDNIDREFLSKLKVLDWQRKDLYGKFISAVFKEWQGRTNALAASTKSLSFQEISDQLETVTSKDVFSAYINTKVDLVKTLRARDYLNSPDPAVLASSIRGINKQIIELNKNFTVIRHGILRAKMQGIEDEKIRAAAFEQQGLETK